MTELKTSICANCHLEITLSNETWFANYRHFETKSWENTATEPWFNACAGSLENIKKWPRFGDWWMATKDMPSPPAYDHKPMDKLLIAANRLTGSSDAS